MGATLLMASMALLALQPAVITVSGGGGGGKGRDIMGGGDGYWREFVKQGCGVLMASAGLLALTGIVSPTK